MHSWVESGRRAGRYVDGAAPGVVLCESLLPFLLSDTLRLEHLSAVLPLFASLHQRLDVRGRHLKEGIINLTTVDEG